MMRRLFAAVVKPTVAYGCEIWGTLSVGYMVPELRKMALAFYRQMLRLKKAVPGHLILAELDEVPWGGLMVSDPRLLAVVGQPGR